MLSNLSVGVDKAANGEDEGGELLQEKRNYKLYNFRRPDKFSKDHLRALQTIHENFARQLGMVLTAYLRMTVELDVISVDQLTYTEFVNSMPSPMTVSILEMAPLPGQVLLGVGSEVTGSVIDRMLGGTGTVQSKNRELTDIEQLLIKRVLERAYRTLEEAWQSMMNLTVSMVGMEESYALIQIATPGEIIALVTFEVNLGNRETGIISLCIPFPVLEGIIGQLSAQHIFHGQQNKVSQDEHDKIIQKLNLVKMPLNVLLGGTSISVGELLDLSVGDVIPLDRKAQDPLLVTVNGKPKFFARPGTLKKNLAVSVTEAVDEEEAIEGFGLYAK